MALKGEAKQLIIFENARPIIVEATLRAVFMDESVKGLPVVILSVAGAFRKGKSFLLGFCLRYLSYLERGGTAGSPLWLGKPDEPLKGFSWRGGTVRDTTGILIWSHPFIITLPGKGEVAVFLMDTQGTFDNETTTAENTFVFALSTLISSVQVYNLSENIHENELQQLQLFTEYGILAKKEANMTTAAFQSLVFLVRNWQNPDELAYGATGGEKYLEKVLKVSKDQQVELKAVREHIWQSFVKISCFLMPYPGSTVATKKHFDGRLSDIDPEFRKELHPLMRLLLDPAGLPIKEINGQEVTCEALTSAIRAYVTLYASGEIQKPRDIYTVNALLSHQLAYAKATDLYTKAMNHVCQEGKIYKPIEIISDLHDIATLSAIATFNGSPLIGSAEMKSRFDDRIREFTKDQFKLFKAKNDMNYCWYKDFIKMRLNDVLNFVDGTIELVRDLCTAIGGKFPNLLEIARTIRGDLALAHPETLQLVFTGLQQGVREAKKWLFTD